MPTIVNGEVVSRRSRLRLSYLPELFWYLLDTAFLFVKTLVNPGQAPRIVAGDRSKQVASLSSRGVNNNNNNNNNNNSNKNNQRRNKRMGGVDHSAPKAG